MGSNIGSASLTLISVVGVGTLIGCIEVMTSSSVLFSNLYPLVAVLFGAAVVVRLLVESVFRSLIPLIVVFMPGLVGCGLRGFPDVVLFADERGVVVLKDPVVLLGLVVVVDDFVGALGSV